MPITKYLLNRLDNRIILSIIIYFLAIYHYPIVFSMVGYMYEFEIELNFVLVVINLLLLLLLLFFSNCANIFLRHYFDFIILGIFLPISVVISFMPHDFHGMYTLSVPFATSLILILLPKLFISKQIIIGLFEKNYYEKEFKNIFLLLLIFLILFILYTINTFGFTFNIYEIYINTYLLRVNNQSSGIIGYFVGSLVLLIMPLSLSFTGKIKYLFISITFIAVYLIFAVFARKIIMFDFLLLFTISIFLTSYLKNKSLGIFFKNLPYYFYLSLFILSLFMTGIHPLLDRFFYLVGVNSVYYLDFFTNHDYMYYAYTKLDLGISNYHQILGYIIDDNYYQGKGVNQSAGFLPTSFANFGLFSLFINTIILSIIVYIISKLLMYNIRVAYLFLVALALSLSNHNFLMLFLSNGLFFVILISLYIINKKRKKNVQK